MTIKSVTYISWQCHRSFSSALGYSCRNLFRVSLGIRIIFSPIVVKRILYDLWEDWHMQRRFSLFGFVIGPYHSYIGPLSLHDCFSWVLLFTRNNFRRFSKSIYGKYKNTRKMNFQKQVKPNLIKFASINKNYIRVLYCHELLEKIANKTIYGQ